jgi:hypothetical protein
MPVSAAPPGGGSLELPASLGGQPAVGVDPQPQSWFSEVLPGYPAGDARLTYYRGPSGTGVASAMAIRGPYTDLPDLTSTEAERTNVGDVQCAKTVFDGANGPTEMPGYACWRTSGDFSVSVLTDFGQLDQVVSLVNELWDSQ